MKELFDIIHNMDSELDVLCRSTNVNCTNSNGETLFSYACKMRNFRACDCLLENPHFNINISDLHGFTPLMLCIVYEYLETFITVCNKCPEYDQYNVYGNNALLIACKYNRYIFVEKLLARGASVSRVNSHGDTPLHVAVEVNNINIIKKLCEYNAGPFYKNINMKSPLELSVELNHVGATNTIIYNSIFEGIEHGNISLLLYIATIPGIHFNIRKNGKTPLNIASKNGNLEIVKIIVEKMEYEDLTINDEHVMFNALVSNRTDIIEYLCAKNIPIETGLRDMFYSSRIDKHDIIKQYLPRNIYPFEITNEIFDSDGAIHEEPHINKHCYRKFIFGNIEYIYDVLFLFKYWDFQYHSRCFTKDGRNNILFNFPMHTGTFFSFENFNKIIMNSSIIEWNVKKSGVITDIRPSSPGLNRMDSIELYHMEEIN